MFVPSLSDIDLSTEAEVKAAVEAYLPDRREAFGGLLAAWGLVVAQGAIRAALREKREADKAAGKADEKTAAEQAAQARKERRAQLQAGTIAALPQLVAETLRGNPRLMRRITCAVISGAILSLPLGEEDFAVSIKADRMRDKNGKAPRGARAGLAWSGVQAGETIALTDAAGLILASGRIALGKTSGGASRLVWEVESLPGMQETALEAVKKDGPYETSGRAMHAVKIARGASDKSRYASFRNVHGRVFKVGADGKLDGASII